MRPDTPRPNRANVALVFYSLCVTAALLVLLDRASPEPRLAPTTVAADRETLDEVGQRLVVDSASGGVPSVVLTFGSRCGGIAGVARGGAPGFLWFTLGRRPGFFQEPTRAEVPTVLLARNTPAGSSLVRPGTSRRIAVSLSGGGSPEAGDASTGTIDNLRDGMVAATVSGWDLPFAWRRPHCELTERDVRAMALLARFWSVRVIGLECETCPTVVTRLWRESAPRHLGFAIDVGGKPQVEGRIRLRYLAEATRPMGLVFSLTPSAGLEHPLELELEPGTAPPLPVARLVPGGAPQLVEVDLEPLAAAIAGWE